MTQLRSQWFGIFFIFLAQLLFCTNFSIVAYLSDYFTFIQLILFRSILAPILFLPLLFTKKINLNFKRPWLLLTRATCGLIAMSCLYIGLKEGEVGQVNLVFNFSIIWTFIIAFFLFKDRPHRFSLTSLAIAFLGLGFVFFPFSTTLNKGTLFAFIGSIFAAGVILSLKSLRKTHDSFSIIFFFQSFASIVYFIPAKPTLALIDNPFILLIILTGIISFSAQWFMTKGYKFTTASVASTIGLAQIPLMYLSGYLFFDQHITLINMMGVFIVLFCLTVISIFR